MTSPARCTARVALRAAAHILFLMSRPAESATARATSAAVWIALGVVYVVWGTTYLAIRVVNETLPTLLAASVRFLVAGGIMYAITIRRGDREGDRPGPRHWRAALVAGAALLLCGNGGVVWAERTVPSGLAALIVAIVPLWMALIDRVLLAHRPTPQVAFGLLAGFGGAALLVGASARGNVPLAGMLIAVAASLCWAAGSLYSRSAPMPKRPFVGVGMEMLCGGALLAIVAIATGELGEVHPERFSLASVLALAHLIVFGSLVGFGSYVWLLRNAPTSLVSTYAYVNPVVAVLLGWIILGEPITLRTVAAGAIILASVALILSAKEMRPAPDLASGAEDRGGGVEGDLALEGVGDPQEERLAQDGRGDLDADG
ncbi:MAG: EamA family transporter [Actinomycetota bacterium]